MKALVLDRSYHEGVNTDYFAYGRIVAYEIIFNDGCM